MEIPDDQPVQIYTVENTEDTRAVLLSTVKEILQLPKEKVVFMDAEVSFRHREAFTTEVINKMTVVKGPQERNFVVQPTRKEIRIKRKEEKKHTRENMTKEKLHPNRADRRVICGGEHYAIRAWTTRTRGELTEEEPAVYERGERDDATSKDTISWETNSVKSETMDKIQLIESEFVGQEKQNETNKMEKSFYNEEKKDDPLLLLQKGKENEVREKREQAIIIQESKELISEKKSTLATGCIDMKPGPKDKTEVVLTINTSR